MTPTFIGRIAVMFPGVFPSIFFAFSPTATTFLELLYTATTLGSLVISFVSLAYTSVFAVPRSIPMSFEKISLIPAIIL